MRIAILVWTRLVFVIPTVLQTTTGRIGLVTVTVTVQCTALLGLRSPSGQRLRHLVHYRRYTAAHHRLALVLVRCLLQFGVRQCRRQTVAGRWRLTGGRGGWFTGGIAVQVWHRWRRGRWRRNVHRWCWRNVAVLLWLRWLLLRWLASGGLLLLLLLLLV